MHNSLTGVATMHWLPIFHTGDNEFLMDGIWTANANMPVTGIFLI